MKFSCLCQRIVNILLLEPFLFDIHLDLLVVRIRVVLCFWFTSLFVFFFCLIFNLIFLLFIRTDWNIWTRFNFFFVWVQNTIIWLILFFRELSLFVNRLFLVLNRFILLIRLLYLYFWSEGFLFNITFALFFDQRFLFNFFDRREFLKLLLKLFATLLNLLFNLLKRWLNLLNTLAPLFQLLIIKYSKIFIFLL